MRRSAALFFALALASLSSAQIISNVGGSYDIGAHADSGDVFQNSPQSGPMPVSDTVFANANDIASSSLEINSGTTAAGGLFINMAANAIVTAGESGAADAGGLAFFEFELAGPADLVLAVTVTHIDDQTSSALIAFDQFDGNTWQELFLLQGGGEYNQAFKGLKGGVYRLYVGTSNSSSNDYAQTFASATLNPVPEPATLGVLAAGAGWVVGRRRRRDRHPLSG